MADDVPPVGAAPDAAPGAAPASGPLHGRQTTLAMTNFPGASSRLGEVPELVRAYAWVKSAAAAANAQLGVVDANVADAIRTAAAEMGEGLLDSHLGSPVLQGGGGTSTNMNVNEVLAARATQLLGRSVHPNDDVNASQSTNDTYPTAMALAVHARFGPSVAAIDELAGALASQAETWHDVRRLGRTCLQDAVTLTVGQTHGGHAAGVRRVAHGVEQALVGLLDVPLGATVLGTGIGAPTGYRRLALDELASLSGLPVRPCPNPFDQLANLDGYAAVADAASRAAVVVTKVAADLRLLGSGPVGGLGEVVLPEVQAGSSIMPGKVNPVIPEYVMQLGFRLRGRALTVALAVAAGELELNVMEPVIVESLLGIADDLGTLASALDQGCVRGLRWDGPRLRENVRAAAQDSWVDMARERGYDAATRAVRGRGRHAEHS